VKRVIEELVSVAQSQASFVGALVQLRVLNENYSYRDQVRPIKPSQKCRLGVGLGRPNQPTLLLHAIRPLLSVGKQAKIDDVLLPARLVRIYSISKSICLRITVSSVRCEQR
jgi:hypothetical protein